VKLKYLASWSEAHRTNALRYRALFVEVGLPERIILPEDSPGHIYNQSAVRLPDRDSLQIFRHDRGIGTAVYYPLPFHLQVCLDLGCRKGDFPHVETAASESLGLPIYPQ
jgi:dTDP-4-amino-4,6-dideoxygalactose transaminase